MEDVFTAERQAWIKRLSQETPLCYQRNPDGSFVLKYTPAAEQHETYLRDKFQAMKAAA